VEITHTTTPKLEALREEVRVWLEEELPQEYEGFYWGTEERPEHWAFYRQFWKKQGAKRWIEPGWPREYGGAEMSPRACRLVNEELRRRRAGDIAGIGRSVGRNILRLGTEEQKKSFLPGMAAGEILWAEGFTEPDAGSDLASLRTRAERDGDEWVINGQKTMTSGGHHMNWIIIAARSDPKSERHRGISYFLSPTDASGIEFRPLYNLADGCQNLTFLDEVRVSENRMLGDVHEGWTQLWFGLGGNPLPIFEEDDPGPEEEYDPPLTEDVWGVGTWILDQLVQYCRTTSRNGRPLSEDPVVRLQLADLAIGAEIEKVLAWEGPCQYGGATHQAITKEFAPRHAQTCMEIVGPLGQIQSGRWAALAGRIEFLYRWSFGVHGGGTSQLKRMVVATRALGLPR
jgi:alkylation response protein AidB-like acyl-CoA dehydrogenase